MPFNATLYALRVIRSFKCRDTQALYGDKRVRRFANIDIVATRKLQLLDDAAELWDLSAPSANRLEANNQPRGKPRGIDLQDEHLVEVPVSTETVGR